MFANLECDFTRFFLISNRYQSLPSLKSGKPT